MRVIGTAGHVDHGKSTLVEALTGIHPDRLKEEREREMTIDLGFAWLTLPGGEPVGVIDVPGHRDFIENMLAGVGGLDLALLVIAADEGVMPQTREHLAILDLLRLPAGLIALTKSDLVEAEWLELVTGDVRAAVRGTVMETAAIVPVSARTGAGLDQLQAALQAGLAARPPRPDRGRPRLPIDRVFNLTGFGTVVTGTLLDGGFELGEAVEIVPSGLGARIRGLQTHQTKIERGQPGSRLAINLSGVETNDLQRGMVVARPGALRPTTRLDAQVELLGDADLPLKHNAEVKLFVGAAEVVAKIRLLEADELKPGQTAWVQLQCAQPLAAARGDRFILRRPSPAATIGGGVLLDAHPARQHRRRDPAVIRRLETLSRGTPGEMLLQALDALGPAPLPAALAKAGLEAGAESEALAELRAGGDLIELTPEGLVLSQAEWSRFETGARDALAAHHADHPLRAGMPREELKSRLKLAPRAFNALLARAVEQGRIAVTGSLVRLPTHQIEFSPAQQARVDALLADFRRDPFNTPLPRDCAARVGDDVLGALIELGTLIAVSADVLLLAETHQSAVERIAAHIRATGRITVAEARDLFKTSRKYALALLEHLDAAGVTKRVGDERVLR